MKKHILIYILLFLFTGPAVLKAEKYQDLDRIYTRAEITAIEEHTVDRGSGLKLKETWIMLKILDGELKGSVKKAVFGGENDMPRDMQYRIGQKVFIGIARAGYESSTEYISLYDIDNTLYIIILVLLMVLAIVGIGRIKGFTSLIALCISILLFFMVLIPATLKGYPPLPIAVGLSILSILITLPLIAGLRLKTLAAILGASGGIILASFLALLFGSLMHLSGLVTNDMLTVFYASDVSIDLRGLALSGMIIAALGAVMDICISISSSAAEIYRANPNIPEKKAFSSVLTIGTDILGSMVNTLILAYVGSSMSLILLIAMKLKPEMPFTLILNYNPVLGEIIKSVIGSLGMFLSIPLTAWIAVKLYSRSTHMRNKNKGESA